MKKKVLILTKSNKRRHDGSYGKCIAGIMKTNGQYKWVRLVADRAGDSIKEEVFPFEPLELIEVDLTPCPLDTHVENCTYGNPKKLVKINENQLKNLFKKMPHSFFGSMSSRCDTQPQSSLTWLLATNLHIYWEEDGERKRQKIDFKMGNNTATGIAMTDPQHYTKKSTSEEKTIPLAICVASLPSSPVYNKFIASIFPINEL